MRVHWFGAAAVLMAVLAPNCNAADVAMHGRVVGVTDGDTLTFYEPGQRKLKIRISGIDAPEKGQAFSQAAKARLAELAFRRQAVVTCHKVDRFKRLVCNVEVDRKDVGLELIRSGVAWHFKRYEAEQPRYEAEHYRKAEEVARARKAGLWSDPHPVPPWEWRSRAR